MSKEFILILDDELEKGGELEQAISEAGYKCELVRTIPKAKEILETKNVSFLVLDVWLKKINPNLTSIDFALEITPKRPTLFITQFSDSKNNQYFQRIVHELPHATYVARRAINWTDDVIKGMTLAKEKFKLYQFNKNNATFPNTNKITFNIWHGNRVFLEKDKILFITSHKKRNELYLNPNGLNRGLNENQITAFEKAVNNEGEFCVFYTSDNKFIPFGTRIGRVEKQLGEYKMIGWNFARVHNQYIINIDLIEEFVNGSHLKLMKCPYLIPITTFHDGDASDFFPFLQA